MPHQLQQVRAAPPAPVGVDQARPLVTVSTDAEAVMRFLNRVTTTGAPRLARSTHAAYKKECRRLLWYCGQHNLAFKSLSLEDAQAFVVMLQEPSLDLIGTAKRPFGDSNWKPFVVAKDWTPGNPVLSPASVHQAVAAIKSLFTWLQKVGYLTLNPFALLDTHSEEKKRIEMSRKNRVLHLEDISLVLDHLQQSEKDSLTTPKVLRKVKRQRWLFYAYLYSGLRISELLSNDTGSLQLASVNGKRLWVLYVIGKGSKPSEIPVSEGFMSEFCRYRLSLGLPATPAPNKPEPFFFNITGKKPLKTRQQLHDIFKELTREVAESLLSQNRVHESIRIQSSSVHWLRHSFVTLAMDATNDLGSVMELARHNDIKTTMAYDKSRMTHLSDLLEKIAKTIG